MVTGGIDVTTNIQVKIQQAKGSYIGAFTRMKHTGLSKKERDTAKGIYRSQLNAAASRWSDNLGIFKEFQKGVEKYAVQTKTGDLSFESFVKKVKYLQKNRPSDGIARLHSGAAPKGLNELLYSAKAPKEYRKLYVEFMTDYIMEEHDRNLKKAQKNFDKVAAGLVPNSKLDLTSINIEVIQDENGNDSDIIVHDKGISLQMFLDTITSEGTLKRQTRKDYFNSNLGSDAIKRKDAKDRNWMESWYVNLEYSLTEMGWYDLFELLEEARKNGYSLKAIYDTLFKSTYYNFVFNYNESVGGHSAEYEELKNAILAGGFKEED